jgi:hypothetical protein
MTPFWLLPAPSALGGTSACVHHSLAVPLYSAVMTSHTTQLPSEGCLSQQFPRCDTGLSRCTTVFTLECHCVLQTSSFFCAIFCEPSHDGWSFGDSSGRG